MPQKKQSETELRQTMNAGIEAIEDYLGIHKCQASEAISKTIPQSEEKTEEPIELTSSPALNQFLNNTVSVGRSAYSMFSTGVQFANNHLIHSDEVKQERKRLAQECWDTFVNSEEEISPTDGVNMLKSLLVSNMVLSQEKLGKEYINSGELYKGLRDALKLNDKGAYKLVTEHLSEINSEALTTH